MALLPNLDPMYHALNDKEIVQDLRPYLGLSMIGNNCRRYMQHYHYWTFQTVINTRIKRLFSFGHMMEPYMIGDLANLGVFVKGEQTSMVGTGGHWQGHCDGVAISEANPAVDFLAEFKTHNEKNFKSLLKLGVKAGYPKHHHQCNSYMGYLELPYTFYLGYNKNDSAYHYETIQFDLDLFKEDQRKEADVIMSDVLLPRIGNNMSTWFECKLCDARETCFQKKPVHKSCRSCKHVDVLDEGRWLCSDGLNPHELSVEEQRVGCEFYDLGEMFK